MILKTQGFVLKKYKFRETSLIVHLYTRDSGKIKAIAKGVRQLKSRKISHFEIPVLLDLQIYDKPNRELQLLSDSFIVDYFSKVKEDVELFVAASYALELVDSFTQVHLKGETIFRLLHAFLAGLTKDNFRIYSLAFSIKLLKTLGIFPNLLHCFRCKKEIQADAFLDYEQGIVFCEEDFLRETPEVIKRITPQEITLIFELIRETFTEIGKKQIDEQTLLQIEELIRSYINYLTQLSLKTPKVQEEITEQITGI